MSTTNLQLIYKLTLGQPRLSFLFLGRPALAALSIVEGNLAKLRLIKCF